MLGLPACWGWYLHAAASQGRLLTTQLTFILGMRAAGFINGGRIHCYCQRCWLYARDGVMRVCLHVSGEPAGLATRRCKFRGQPHSWHHWIGVVHLWPSGLMLPDYMCLLGPSTALLDQSVAEKRQDCTVGVYSLRF